MTYDEKKSLYENIMKDVAKTVKQHLYETETFDRFDDMFGTSEGHRDLKVSFMNVYDMAERRHYDRQWAENIQPNPKFSYEELLKRYVCALIIFKCQKPTCLKDVLNIGIFKNYMIEYLDKTKNYDVFNELKLPSMKLLTNSK